MSEAKIKERHVLDVVRRTAIALGFRVFRYPAGYPGAQRGMPDVLLFRGGLVFAIECKAPGKTLRADQVACHECLKAEGIPTVMVDSRVTAEETVREFRVVADTRARAIREAGV